jgi:hypothetical protein
MFRKHKVIKNAEIKSEPYNPKLFPNVTQSTTVTVVMEQPDDGIAECLSGCFSACFSMGKKAATS